MPHSKEDNDNMTKVREGLTALSTSATMTIIAHEEIYNAHTAAIKGQRTLKGREDLSNADIEASIADNLNRIDGDTIVHDVDEPQF